MREQFIDKDFQPKTLAVIEDANAIIAEYIADGYSITLRTLYYQFVARGKIANTQRSYDRLGKIISDGRLAGLIDWDGLDDNLRKLEKLAAWVDPHDMIDGCIDQYRVDPWTDQPYYLEVWVEKEALVGVIEGVCDEWRVPYFACKGYTSQSAQYRAGMRIWERARADKQCVILHLGDHDPSGIHMTLDNRKRLSMFAGRPIEVCRLALNYDQVQQYDPPPNPVKFTDSRSEGYIAEHGYESWELDALPPNVIAEIIRTAIFEYLDRDLFDKSIAREDEGREEIRALANSM